MNNNKSCQKTRTVIIDENGNIITDDKKSKRDLISMVLGIVSLVFCCILGFLGLGAIILSIVDRVKTKKFSKFSIVGLICGIIGLILGTVFLVFMIVAFGTLGAILAAIFSFLYEIIGYMY